MKNFLNVWTNDTDLILFDSPEPVSRTRAIEKRIRSNNITYVIGFGWNERYISEVGSRPHYKTYQKRIAEFKQFIIKEAHHRGDEIISWRYIHAESKSQVKKVFNL